MWMMPLHLHVNQKSDYDMIMMIIIPNIPTPEVCLNLENLTCDPLIFTMNHLKLIVTNQMEGSISMER